MAEQTLNPEPQKELKTEARETLTLGVASLVFLVLALILMFPPLLLVSVGLGLWGACKGLFVVLARETSRPDRWKTAAGMAIALPCLVLAVMTLMAYSGPLHSRGEAKRSKSLSNLKQLALAVHAYAQDYDGRLPGWVKTPGGRMAHNTWDEQVMPHVKSRDVINNGDPGIRSYADPQRQRVVTYGLNGLLITPRKPFDGTADWSRPEPRKVEDIGDPAGAILFAELATEAPMPGAYGQRPDPAPAEANGKPSDPWKSAQDGWIDVDPRAFVETSGPKDSYDTEKWDATRGVARDFYGGGGSYAFVDGHVKFMKLSQTVRGREAGTPDQYWAPDNPDNLWNPDKP